MIERRRRIVLLVFVAILSVLYSIYSSNLPGNETIQLQTPTTNVANTDRATEVLETIEVKGRAPKTDYSRTLFGSDWAEADGCDMRNIILKRDLIEVFVDPIENCKIIHGVLIDPYTAKTINFMRGEQTSDDVQIDHIVALSDAWQKGAQAFDENTRIIFANDPLNLLAVDGPANQNKGDGDAATWLPPNKSYRCRYVARQVAVKAKYHLWVTEAEKDVIKRVLQSCPGQQLPLESERG